MKPTLNRRTMLLAGTATMLTIGGRPSFAQVDQKLTPDEARTLARDAWVFGMPLVYIDLQIGQQTHVGTIFHVQLSGGMSSDELE